MAPLIGITGRVLAQGRISRWERDGVASPRAYCDGVERAGGFAVVLPPVELGPEAARERVAALDGLVLSGGGDVNPSRYGQDRAPETYGVDDLADEFEMALLAAAFEVDLPILAICRGIQVLNVARGGTLDQDIAGREGLIPHGVPNGGEGALHEVNVEPGSRLAKALGADTAVGRSHHHQALATIGAGLAVTATAPDGIVEAVELDGTGWCVGVQWHPEETADTDAMQQSLFDALVRESR
jgi:putative glutamine amidotransferase